jgi:hypothetical protein
MAIGGPNTQPGSVTHPALAERFCADVNSGSGAIFQAWGPMGAAGPVDRDPQVPASLVVGGWPIKVMKAWSRARLRSLGSSCTRAESTAA